MGGWGGVHTHKRRWNTAGYCIVTDARQTFRATADTFGPGNDACRSPVVMSHHRSYFWVITGPLSRMATHLPKITHCGGSLRKKQNQTKAEHSSNMMTTSAHLFGSNAPLPGDPRQFSLSNTEEGRKVARQPADSSAGGKRAAAPLGKSRDCEILQNAAGFFHWLITVAAPCAACKGRGQKEIKHPACRRQTISAGFCKRPLPFKKNQNKHTHGDVEWQLARKRRKTAHEMRRQTHNKI